jgi:hypothetical protein
VDFDCGKHLIPEFEKATFKANTTLLHKRWRLSIEQIDVDKEPQFVGPGVIQS